MNDGSRCHGLEWLAQLSSDEVWLDGGIGLVEKRVYMFDGIEVDLGGERGPVGFLRLPDFGLLARSATLDLVSYR